MLSFIFLPNLGCVWLSCQHQFVSVGAKLSKGWMFQTHGLSKLANSIACVMRCSLLTYNVCSELSAMHKSLSCREQKGDREADENIQCSMKDGGSSSLRPQWWHYIDPATPRAGVHRLLAVSALFNSAVLQLPWSLSETQEKKAQRIGEENADVSGSRQVVQDWLNNS